MKKAKWGILILLATVLLGGAIWCLASWVSPQGDENVQAYKKALDESIGGEFYHYTKTQRVSTVDGEWCEEGVQDFYKCDSNMFYLVKYTDDTVHFLNYNGYNYQARISDEDTYISKYDNALAMNLMHNSSYYSIYDKYVTYKESDTQ